MGHNSQSFQGERRGNKPDFSSSELSPAESAAASRRRSKGCTRDALDSEVTEDGLEHATEEEQQKALMRGLNMIDVATWTVSCRIQPLSGEKVSSSTSRPPRLVKPELPRSPTTSCPNNETNQQTKYIGSSGHVSTTSTSHKTPTQSLCALRPSNVSSSSEMCSHRVPRIVSVREGSDGSRGETPRFADGKFQPFVNFVQDMECPLV